MTERTQFYGDSISGNCYKLQLASSELGIEYHWHEGGFDLKKYAAVRDWLLRVESRNGFVLMRAPSDRH